MSRIFFKRVYVFLMLSMCLVCTMQIFAQEPSLAEQIFQKYQALLQREDVQEALPTVLIFTFLSFFTILFVDYFC